MATAKLETYNAAVDFLDRTTKGALRRGFFLTKDVHKVVGGKLRAWWAYKPPVPYSTPNIRRYTRAVLKENKLPFAMLNVGWDARWDKNYKQYELSGREFVFECKLTAKTRCIFARISMMPTNNISPTLAHATMDENTIRPFLEFFYNQVPYTKALGLSPDNIEAIINEIIGAAPDAIII